MLDDILNQGLFSGIEYTFQVIAFNLILATILSLIISYVYRRTHTGLSYSQSFAFTIVIIGVLITIVMMVIGSNLAVAFGALGAFSLVRFRTAVKDTKDTVYIFLSVALGMAVGTSNYMIAIVGTVVLVILIAIMHKFNFGSTKKYNYILTYSIISELTGDNRIKEVFKKFLKGESLLNVTAREHGKTLDMTFNINFFKEEELDDFTRKLGNIEGVSNVNVIASKSDIEY